MDHRKFRRLVAVLGVGPAQARGHLEMLWDSAYQNGDPYIGDETDVELAAAWTGDAGVLCRAFVECGGVGAGFIDRREDGTYEVHDLFDHAPEYVKSRWRMERKRREAGARVRTERDALETVPNNFKQTGKGYASPAPAPAPIPEKQDHDTSGAAAAAPGVPDLDLTPAEPTKPRFPKPGKGKTPNPDVKRLLDAAVTACQEHRGFKLVIRGAPEAAAMAALLVGRGYEEAVKLVREFYRDPPDWNRDQGTLSPLHIPGAANKILARLAGGNGNGRRDATGAPLPTDQDEIQDTIEVDEQGIERRVRVYCDARTHVVKRRKWGAPVDPAGSGDGTLGQQRGAVSTH